MQLSYKLYIVVFYLVCTLSTQVAAVTWKVQSNKPKNGVMLAIEQRLAKNISVETQGELILDIKPENGYVGLRESFNALRRGQIDAMFMTPQYWGGADPVFPIMGDLVAAWDRPEEYLYWLEHKGGIKYLEAAYQRYGLKLVGYSISPTESLVSSVPIANINDINGKIMRTPPGMITDFFQLLGAKTRNITAAKISKALNAGEISLADMTNIIDNHKLGVYKTLKHTNYPGFHSMPLYDFVVNQKAWDALSSPQQKSIRNAMLEWRKITTTTNQKKLARVMADLSATQVNIYRWEAQEIIKARQKAIQVWDKYALKSPQAGKLIKELKLWLKEIGNID